jgi:hypothetical protein
MEGMIIPLGEPEPSDVFGDLPYKIGLLFKMCWSLAENQEFGSWDGSWLKNIVLPMHLHLPLHITLQSQ